MVIVIKKMYLATQIIIFLNDGNVHNTSKHFSLVLMMFHSQIVTHGSEKPQYEHHVTL